MSAPPASRSAALDYLRATLTVMVVGHHSSLAYTTFAASEPGNYLGGTAPIVDTARWVFLDHAENFNDVFFMSAMFFISGIFAWGSLHRRGPISFVQERLLRLGLPFLLGVIFVMPIAYYAAYLFSGGRLQYLAYWRQNLFDDGMSPGPLWFIWVLLLFNLAVAVSFPLWRWLDGPIERLGKFSGLHPLRFAAAILLVCAIAYFPLLARYGPSAWTAFFTGPFYFQQSRFALYFAWFVIGCVTGANGLQRGLLASSGAMVQHAGRWLIAALAIFAVMEFIPRALFDAGILAEDPALIFYAILWLISCVASTLAFLAIFLRYATKPNAIMDSLARNAYLIYIVHYIFVLWMQYALLQIPLLSGIKFIITFAGALLLSYFTAASLLRVRILRAVL